MLPSLAAGAFELRPRAFFTLLLCDTELMRYALRRENFPLLMVVNQICDCVCLQLLE